MDDVGIRTRAHSRIERVSRRDIALGQRELKDVEVLCASASSASLQRTAMASGEQFVRYRADGSPGSSETGAPKHLLRIAVALDLDG